MLITMKWSIAVPVFSFVIICLLDDVYGQTCQMPDALKGKNMTSNAAGPVTFTDTSVIFHEGFRNCTADSTQCPVPLTFECRENQDNKYFLRAEGYDDPTNGRVYLYICWYLSSVTDQKWVYYQGPTDFNVFYNSYVLNRYSSINVVMDDVCNLKTPLPVDRYNLLLDSDLLRSQSSSCPDALLGTFDTELSASCATEVNVCSTSTRQTVIFNDTSCESNGFFADYQIVVRPVFTANQTVIDRRKTMKSSTHGHLSHSTCLNFKYISLPWSKPTAVTTAANGTMDCLLSLSQNDVTYVMMYTPSNDTVTFSCLAYIQDGSDLYINQQAESCITLQAPTNTSSELFFKATVLCPFPCTFPAELSGTWFSSRKGREVTWNSTTVTNFFTCSTPTCSSVLSTLECYRNENDRYLLRTPVTTINNEAARVYMCLDLSRVSSSTYLYYQLHTGWCVSTLESHSRCTTSIGFWKVIPDMMDASKPTHDSYASVRSLRGGDYLLANLSDYVVIFNSGQSVALSQACDDLSVSPYRATRYGLFLKPGSIMSAFSACPSDMFGTFNDTSGACESSFELCEDDTLLNVACTPKLFFADKGDTVGCLYSVTMSGAQYVTMYNTDNPSDASSFNFICVAMSLSGSTLKLSQHPQGCVDSQTPDSINSSSGALYTFERSGDCPVAVVDDSSLSLTIIIVIVVVCVLVLIVIILICVFCWRKCHARRRKETQDAAAILKKEEEEEEGRTSNLSVDSGYPQSSTSPDGGRPEESRGLDGRGLGTPRTHIVEVYEVAEEEGPKQVNVIPRRRHRRQQEPASKDGQQTEDSTPGQTEESLARGEGYETDGEADYSDASWEEYVDEEGNAQVRQKQRRRRRRRQRRRKKVKQVYSRTRILEDGTTVQEEVESEFSVTASSDMTSSSDEDRESIGDQIREAKEKRKTRLQKIMDKSTPPLTSTIVTREMDEKAHQPEKKRESLWKRLRRRAGGHTSKTRVKHQGRLQRRADKTEVPGVRREKQAIPYLLKYQKKKDMDRVLHDEGFFDDAADRMTAEAVFGFQEAERKLSPKPEHFNRDEIVDEEMMTATDSSPADDQSTTSHEESGTIPDFLEQGSGILKVASKHDRTKHVIIDPPLSSMDPSSDSELREEEEDSSERKGSDTSSGVADLSQSPTQQPPSPAHSRARTVDNTSRRESRRVSVGWEKLQTMYSRNRGLVGRDQEGRGTTSRLSNAGKVKQRKDKRVKTALRRLLNERLFGSSDKKKSRRENSDPEDWTTADSVGNNVSVTSSALATRNGTRQSVRPVTQGKVAFAENDTDESISKGSQASRKPKDLSPNSRVRLSLGNNQQSQEDSDHNVENDENRVQERQPTGAGSKLPPLRTPTMPLSRVFMPVNYPKWGLCVTASQRSMLVEGLERDRTFLSRQRAQTAWSGKPDDSMILPPKSRENGAGEETTDDESILDPHRPETVGSTINGNNTGGQPWAHKRPAGPRSHTSQSVSFTHSSGRNPLDIDDKRLRRLLEELYKDKKFMDKLINVIDEEHLDFPDHIAAEDVKFLSEFGRSYLLERAEYWDLNGPLGPPRPPPTAIGMRLSRAQTSLAADDVHQSTDSCAAGSPRPKTVR